MNSVLLSSPPSMQAADGAVWVATVSGQRCVRVREGGEVLTTVPVDRGCFAI